MNWIQVGQNQDGRLQVFGIDTYGTFLGLWQTVPGGGPWTNWATLGGAGEMASALAIGSDLDGRLEVFAFHDEGGVSSPNTWVHIWQSAPDSENWSMWQPLQDSMPSGYAFYSGENGSCNFSGTANVAYGANGSFVFKNLTDGTACDNNVFGDPAHSVVKACFIPGGPAFSTPGGPESYTFCSTEGGNCSFFGTVDVAYGANGHFIDREITNNVFDRFYHGTACNNSVFGDPDYGVLKACFIRDAPFGFTVALPRAIAVLSQGLRL